MAPIRGKITLAKDTSEKVTDANLLRDKRRILEESKSEVTDKGAVALKRFDRADKTSRAQTQITTDQEGYFVVKDAPPLEISTSAPKTEAQKKAEADKLKKRDILLAAVTTELDDVDVEALGEAAIQRAAKKACCNFPASAQASMFLLYPIVDLINAINEGNRYSAVRMGALAVAAGALGYGAIALGLGSVVLGAAANEIAKKALEIAVAPVAYYIGDKAISLVRFFQSCRSEDAPSTTCGEKVVNLFRPTNNPARS